MRRTIAKLLCVVIICTMFIIPNTGCMTYEDLVDKLMEEAQNITNFTRDNNFIYGDAQINPCYNWPTLNSNVSINPNERLTACDRLVSWILYRAGFTDQTYQNGCDLEELFKKHNFKKLDKLYDFKAGDIVFVNPNSNGSPTHVYMIASEDLGGETYLRYDHGSDARIQCVTGTEETPGQQPFREPAGDVVFAYRPSASNMTTSDYTNLYKAPSTKVALPGKKSKKVSSLESYDTGASGWGNSTSQYKYKPGKKYDQFELHLDLTIPFTPDDHLPWIATFVGARLPASEQEPTTNGGVWLAFQQGTKAYLYAGINFKTGNWHQVPLATFNLPEPLSQKHKITVVDNGDMIKYFMTTSSGDSHLICTIKLDEDLDWMAVFDNSNTMAFVGKAVVGESGYFRIWTHSTQTIAENIIIKGYDD